MKYWKGIGPKNGQYGTCGDNGSVPDSEPATKAEYDAWVALQPPLPQDPMRQEYAAAVNDGQRVAILARRCNLV